MRIKPMAETRDGWDLRLRGATVTRCYIDEHAVGFLLDDPADSNVYLEGSFAVSLAGRRAEFGVAEGPMEYAPLVSLIGRTVEAARVTHSGELVVEFDDGRRLSAGPDPHYEAWNVTIEDLLVVCIPGGGISTGTHSSGPIMTMERLVHSASTPDSE